MKLNKLRYCIFIICFNFFTVFDCFSGSIQQPVSCNDSCTVIQAHSFQYAGGPYKYMYTSIDFDNCGNRTLGSQIYGSSYIVSYNIWKFQENTFGDIVWMKIASIDQLRVTQEAGQALMDKYNNANFIEPSVAWPSGCPGSCEVGKINYDLKQYDNPDQPPIAGKVCYEDCQQSSEILWSDCLAGSCVASVKYTQTGEPCGTETSVDNLQENEPQRCQDEINEKIAQCGGSLKVLSFDFETCTGECTPDACGDEWTALVNRCGGIMAVSSWNAETCSGSCVNDPVPDPEDPNTEAVPEEVKKETVTNSDGTSQVTTTTTYSINNVEYTETTVTTYDSSGNVTGTTTSTSTSQPDGETEAETFNAISDTASFATAYDPGPFDIPTRFNTFLANVKSSSLFSFSTSFFESLPSGGSSVYSIDAGRYGSHTIDLSDTMSIGLAVLKSILLACFGFLSIRAVIMKR